MAIRAPVGEKKIPKPKRIGSHIEMYEVATITVAHPNEQSRMGSE